MPPAAYCSRRTYPWGTRTFIMQSKMYQSQTTKDVHGNKFTSGFQNVFAHDIKMHSWLLPAQATYRPLLTKREIVLWRTHQSESSTKTMRSKIYDQYLLFAHQPMIMKVKTVPDRGGMDTDHCPATTRSDMCASLQGSPSLDWTVDKLFLWSIKYPRGCNVRIKQGRSMRYLRQFVRVDNNSVVYHPLFPVIFALTIEFQ